MKIDHILYRAFELLSPQQRTKFLTVSLLLVINSLLDFISIASYLPLIILIINPESIQTNYIVKNIYQLFNFTNTTNFGIALTCLVLLFIIVKTRVNHYITYRKAICAYAIGGELASLAATRYLKLSYLEFTRIDFSKELNRISNIPLTFANNIIIPAGTLVSETLVFLLLCVAIALYQFKLFILLLLILVPAYFIYQLQRKKVSAISRTIADLYPRLLKHTMQLVEGFVDIRSFQKESFFKKRFTKTSGELGSVFSMDHVSYTATARTTEFVAAVCICTMVLFTLLSGQNQRDTLLMLSIYAGASFRIIPSINRIFTALHQIRSNEHAVNELRDLTALKEDDFENPVTALDFKNSITLKNISFNYAGHDSLLHHLNWKIEKRKKVALTGKSGNGKTTLLLILLQHLLETEGELLLDDKALNPPDTIAWRKLFGYVPQSPYVLDASIAENVAFGVPVNQIDHKRVNSLLIDMDLGGWVENLPDGINTIIGEKGAKISGGQRQRLAIARSLYHGAEILLLDEVTNQLDPKTEAEIFASLLKATTHKTIIMITHHPGLLQQFDKVFEVRSGMIHEIASHQLH